MEVQFWNSFYLEISMGTTIEISRGFVQIFEHIFVIEIFYMILKNEKIDILLYWMGLKKKWRVKIYMVGSGHADRRAGWPLCFNANFRNLIEMGIY